MQQMRTCGWFGVVSKRLVPNTGDVYQLALCWHHAKCFYTFCPPVHILSFNLRNNSMWSRLFLFMGGKNEAGRGLLVPKDTQLVSWRSWDKPSSVWLQNLSSSPLLLSKLNWKIQMWRVTAGLAGRTQSHGINRINLPRAILHNDKVTKYTSIY